MSRLYLKQLKVGPMQNFVYLVGAKDAREVAVVDPAWEPDTIVAAAQKDDKEITHLLVTHSHYDHINAVESLLGQTKSKVVAQDAEADFSEVLRGFGKDLVRVHPGDVVNVGPLGIRCIHTPGHTPGSQCFHVEHSLVSGDTLFIKACGRCDLRGGDPAQMFDTLEHTLARLPDDTALYPGHDYADRPVSTIGDEKRENPYLQVHDLGAFLDLRMRPRR